MKIIFILISLILCAFMQTCDVSTAQRVDCGYLGIQQAECQKKGCCWRPAFLKQQPNDIPWCYYKAQPNQCQNISFVHTSGPGFDSTFYTKMYDLFIANIDIQSKGGVAAAPGDGAPIGSYFYHWMRDAGLTMRAFQQLNDLSLTKVQAKMKSYINFVLKVQNQTDPNGYDVRINPKFQLPNGQVYVGGWCRPQTDGPGLTAASLIMFANLLLDAGQTSYVYQNLWTTDGTHHGGAIKYDLDWIVNNWQSLGCDLWEQIRQTDFFWNRMAFAYTLQLATKLANRLGDTSLASKYSSTKSSIEATLNGHWTGTYMTEASSRQRDGAVLHAFMSFPGYYQWTDSKIALTIKQYASTFCNQYLINQQDIKAGIPGILIGRYPGDVYAGGNPWQLLSAALAELFYKGASAISSTNYIMSIDEKQAWSNLLKINKESSQLQYAVAVAQAGDAVLYRLYQHVKNDNGHIYQQISKQNGSQLSAKDLTWSFANILTAMHYRNTHLVHLTKLWESKEMQY